MDDQLPPPGAPWNQPSGAASPLPPPPPPAAALSGVDPLPPLPAGPPTGAPTVPVSLPVGPPSIWAPGTAPGPARAAEATGWSMAEPTYVAPTAPPRRSRRVAVIAAVAIVLVGGLATVMLVKRQGGQTYGSPETAVRSFVEAITKRDVLGAVEALAPAERDLAVDVLDDWRTARPSGAPSDADLRSLDGYTLEVDGLTTATEQITDDIAVVELTGGTYRASIDLQSLLPAQFDQFKEMFGGDIDTTPSASGDIARDRPLRLATTRDGDGWHVSLFYSIAEAARLDAELPAPDPGTRIAAKGADTPEAAVRQLVDAAAVMDWRRVIELTSPTEMAVLHDYGALLLREAPAQTSEPVVKIGRLEFERQDARHATVLTPTAIAFTIDDADAGPTEVSVERVSPGCWHALVRTAGKTTTDERACASEGFGELVEQLTAEQKAELTRLETYIGVATHQVDGRWYVSPARTIGRLAPASALATELIRPR